MAQLINNALAGGTYNGYPVSAESEISVQLTALSVTKTADRAIWPGGDLGFTIVVTNIDSGEPNNPVTDLTITDYIDPLIAIIDEDSIELTIAGSPVDPVIYTYENGTLIVEVGTLNSLEAAVLTFNVQKP